MSPEPEDPHGAPWWIGLVVGCGMLAFGAVRLLEEADRTKPGEVATWVAGGLVVHDGLIAPVVLAASVALARLLPAAVRGGIQATLVVCCAVTLVSVPVLVTDGRDPGNPSALPHDYQDNLALVLAVIVVVGLAATALRARSAAQKA